MFSPRFRTCHVTKATRFQLSCHSDGYTREEGRPRMVTIAVCPVAVLFAMTAAECLQEDKRGDFFPKRQRENGSAVRYGREKNPTRGGLGVTANGNEGKESVLHSWLPGRTTNVGTLLLGTNCPFLPNVLIKFLYLSQTPALSGVVDPSLPPSAGEKLQLNFQFSQCPKENAPRSV